MPTAAQVELSRTRQQKHRRRRYADMYISREVIMSKAWRALPPGWAIKVYLFFLSKRKMGAFEGSKAKRSGKGKYFIENNGEIQFTYKEAREKYGIPDTAFRTAIDQLILTGFIDIARPGSGLLRDVTLYGISDRWEKYDTDEFIVKKRPKRRYSFGFKRGNTLGRNAENKKFPTVESNS